MNKKSLFKKSLCTILTAALVLQVSETDNISVKKESTASAKSKACTLKLAKKKINVKTGRTCKVKYTASGKVKAVSDKKKIAVAKVKKKYIVIKGNKKGTAVITVTCTAKKNNSSGKNKKTGKIKVTVSNSGSNDQNDNKDPKSTATTKATASPEPTKDPKEQQQKARELSPFSKGVNTFGIKAQAGLHKDNENTFISPFSIYAALSMLANGASGNTYTELVNTLGITDLAQWNSHIADYLKGSLDEKVKINIANSLWLSKLLIPAANIESDFVNPLKQNYNSEVMQNTDFAAPETVGFVNKWIEDKTNGMIRNMLSEFTPDVMALLINTLYFEGEWTRKFEEQCTVDDTFHGSSGDKTVKMMNQYSEFYSYFAGDKFKGIELNYGGRSYAMDILLSKDEKVSTTELWKSLTEDEKHNVLSEFDTAKNELIVNLKLPKFEYEYKSGSMLNEVLKNMGIKDAFIGLKADFTKIGTGPDGPLYVSDVLHNAKVEVNESGTKAAAATVIVLKEASAVMTTGEKIEFIVDRPFIFTIRDKISGMILFIGEINNI